MSLLNLETETQNLVSANFDTLLVSEQLAIINQQDSLVSKAVYDQIKDIEKLCILAKACYDAGGRIIYVGAGNSGRIGLIDAIECPATFGVSNDTFIGIIAGAEAGFNNAAENCEDDIAAAVTDLKNINLTSNDIVIGIAASGRTPYVISAIECAKQMNAKSASICFVKDALLSKYSDLPLEVLTGPEVITGSTRMKAGTATKLILNMISTVVMTNSNKVFDNYMVDVKIANEKLRYRAQTIICEIAGCDQVHASEVLVSSGDNTKIAIVMALENLNKEDALKLLNDFGGSIRRVLDAKK